MSLQERIMKYMQERAKKPMSQEELLTASTKKSAYSKSQWFIWLT